MDFFLSRSADDSFGSFHYPLGLVEHSFSGEAAEIFKRGIEDRKALAQEYNEKELLDIAYAAVSMQHEYRHFYDQFGTIAGISLFSTYIECLKSFERAQQRIVAEKIEWQWPIAKWANSSECPSEVRAFVRAARAYSAGAAAFIGTFDPIQVDGHLDELFVEAKEPGGIPVDLATVRMVRRGNERDEPFTVLYPFGLEVVLEANAHAISRTMVENSFPEAIARGFEQREREVASDQSAASGVLPYMVLDLLISRRMRSRGAPNFNRNLVLGVADELLARAMIHFEHISDTDTALSITTPGSMLEQLLDQGSIEALTAGDVEVSEIVDEGYRTLLASLEQGGDWDTVEDDNSLSSMIRIWESYTAQHFAVPLLRRRLQTDHACFRTIDGFLDMFGEVRPPVMVSDGRVSTGDMPQRVQQAWWNLLFVSQIISSVVDQGPVRCPRAFKAIPGIASVNLVGGHVTSQPTAGRSCGAYASLGCGTFDGGSMLVKPDCPFTGTLQACRFIAPD